MKSTATPKLLISLDYELFFGVRCGTVEKCLLEPTQRLLEVLDKHNAKVSMFVDSGFLCRSMIESEKFPVLQTQRQAVIEQLKLLSNSGHDIQLHIHPHWEDSHFNGTTWDFNTDRYRLHNFSATDIQRIVQEYTQILRDITNKPVFAYRAGGWCIQPFDKLKVAFKQTGIWLDSTVFSSGLSTNENREFDFTQTPASGHWYFNDDPTQSDANGEFLEIPISSIKVSPLFYWKMVYKKLMPDTALKQYGDGAALANESNYYWSRLTKASVTPASIDGLKAGLLTSGYKRNRKQFPELIYNVMGHPKALTPYSLRALDRFLKIHPEIQSITYQDLISLKPSTLVSA